NVELDNVRPNFGHLYQLASDAQPVLDTLDARARAALAKALQVPADAGAGTGSQKLFLPLANAAVLPDCLAKLEPVRESVKGKVEDLWDQGWESGYEGIIYHLTLATLLVLGVAGAAVLLLLRQFRAAVGVLAGFCLVALLLLA